MQGQTNVITRLDEQGTEKGALNRPSTKARSPGTDNPESTP
jgi:hypothetical protein